jgi:predicted nucleic acid-binding protein
VTADFALDTNVAVYAFSEDERNETALSLLTAGPKLSIQLLNEFANIGVRKREVPRNEICESLDKIRTLAGSVRTLSLPVHERALVISERFQLSFYDSLMLAAALLDGCEIFYSEDMQHGMVIDGKLTIINPFLSKLAPK